MKRLLMVALLCLAPITGWAQEDDEEEEKTLADRLITVVSVGGEMQFKPPPFGQVRALSLMLMGGLPLNEQLRAGFGASLQSDAKRRGKTDVELRFDLMAKMKGWPYYGKIHLTVPHLFSDRKGELGKLGFGASGGIEVKLGDSPFFMEVGLNPRTEKTDLGKFRLSWIAEARAGIAIGP